jgi:hypothetical protein
VSPKVSIEIRTADLVAMLAEPRVKVAEALAAARAKGIPLRRTEAGVTQGLAGWQVDHHLQPRGVSLVGAVLVHLQPEPEGDESPQEAAGRALGVSPAWIEGAEAGWAGELLDAVRLAAQDADLYLDAYHVGAALQRHLGYGL